MPKSGTCCRSRHVSHREWELDVSLRESGDRQDIEPDQLPANAPLWSSNSFRSLLLNAIDVVVIVGQDSAIQYASPGVERELGYRAQELMGGSFVDLIHPDDQERLADQFALLRAVPGSDCATEVRSRHSDGTWRWLEVGCTNLTEDPAQGHRGRRPQCDRPGEGRRGTPG